MARAAAGSELKAPQAGPVRFEIASAGHDAELRRLLRENPMHGRISLSLEREPNYFAAAALEGPEHQTIIASENGRVICAGSVSARLRFINGQAMRVGYLGGLRLDASCHGRSAIILRGYEMFRRLHEQGGPLIYLTSIVGDNVRARRLLERGLRGMPTYRLVGELVTMMISTRGGKRSNAVGANGEMAEMLRHLERELPRFQFAPAWRAADFRLPGMNAESFSIVRSSDGAVAGCAALWDQRGIKQAVVRGYAGGMARLRPFINATAAMLGRPRLPAIGEAFSQAFISHFACPAEDGAMALGLIESLRQRARAMGIDYLTLGLDVRDPRVEHLRKVFSPHEYLSRIYAVHWDDGAKLAAALDDRLLGPEVAIL